MTRTELLSTVLSQDGWYCVVGLKKTGHPRQVFVEDLQGVEDAVQVLLDDEFDVYFACSKYEREGSRTNDNVLNIKSFWLDVDCGAGKPYADQAEGLSALKDFCKTVGLPRPTIVNSGRGLHVYWPLTAPITRKE
jgi:DNA primase